MKKPTLSLNSFNENDEDWLGSQDFKNMNPNRNQYHISNYDPACKEHNQIDHIIPISSNLI